MKKIIISAILGLIGGIGGALIFQPISGLMSILFNDFTLGGIIVGIAGGYWGTRGGTLTNKLLFSVGIGLAVFFVLGLLSGALGTDLIAGAFIGLLVGLASHYLGGRVTELVEKADDMIDNTIS